MNNWSLIVRELRAAGLKLSEIASLIGRSPAAVCDIEQGRTSAPNGEAAIKLSELHAARCKSRPQPGTSRKCAGG